MIKTMKQKMSWWKPAVLLPVTATLFFAVACQDQIMEEIKDASKTASVATNVPIEVQARISELQKINPEKKYNVLRFDQEDYSKMKKLEQNNTSSSYVEVIKVEGSENDGNKEQSYVILEKNAETNNLAELTKSDDEVFLVVEENAAPVDGFKEYYKRIGDLMNYPAEARKNGIQGRVFVEFVIQLDGTLADMKVRKGIGYGCDDEAVRAIKEAGLWIPGKQRGKIVKQKMILPVTFSLGNSPSADQVGKSDEFEVNYQINDISGTKTLIGTVTLPDGSPVAGVNVIVSKTTTGTVTNTDGSFKLELPIQSGEVMLTHVSYKSSIIQF